MLLKLVSYKKLVILLIILLSLAGIFLYAKNSLNQDEIYQGISVEDIDLSGMAKDEARKILLEKVNESILGKKITLKGPHNTWTIDPQDISLEYVVDEAIEKAYAIGRYGNILKRINEIMILRKNNINFSCNIDYNKQQLVDILTIIKQQTDKQEEDASLEYKNGEIIKNPEIVGSSMDIGKSYNIVAKYLSESKFDQIPLEIKEIKPRITLDSIKGINGVMSEYRTSFSTSGENRSHNIKLACNKINNTILLPKDSFSMNAALGPRTLENGYKEAPIILKDEYVQDAGGGVCQVTTTLYCAALLSKLRIIERTPHSLPLGYVPASHDATISGDYIDLKLENNLDFAVAINAEVIGGNIFIRILGDTSSQNYTVKLKSEVLEFYEPEVEVIIDNSLPVNEKIVVKSPARGLRSRLYRETYDSKGNLIQRELISEDTYKAVNGQVKMNEQYMEPEIMEDLL